MKGTRITMELTLEQVKPTFDYLLGNWIDAAHAYVEYRESIQQDCIASVSMLNEKLNTALTLRGTMNFCKGKVAGYLVCLQKLISEDDYRSLQREYQSIVEDVHNKLDKVPDFGVLGHLDMD